MADYAMPEMSGLELVRAVRAQGPTLPVVIVTGYAETGDFDDRRLDAVLLKKPFRMNELGRHVEPALARRTAAARRSLRPFRRPIASASRSCRSAGRSGGVSASPERDAPRRIFGGAQPNTQALISPPT